jgi:fucose permease
MGIVVVAAFFRVRVPENGRADGTAATTLPPAFWAYWAMLGAVVAVEFSVLLWAPAFLERVVGMSASAAALGAAAFFAAMLIGRTAGISLIRAFDGRKIFLAAAATTVVGFAAYWGAAVPAVVLVGLFVVGLGISLFFPLTLSFAMESAGNAPDRAATRTMLAPGLAILLSPPLLGAIADNLGLRLAQFATPVFVMLAVAAFLVAERLRRASALSSS